jgi:eukaryotic-like serine/threonine-protein kinase
VARAPEEPALFALGRYAVSSEIASGGMAVVYLGRLLGPIGFSRTVAIKRLHPHLAKEEEFVRMFLDEARLAARIQHPNVVDTLDVVAAEDEVLLVMEYVRGESLTGLTRNGAQVEPSIAVAILTGVLHGLHAAHEAKSEAGEPLGIVHRDVSPQNVLVGADGIARVLDFGVAKAVGRLTTTREGGLKGKLPYMSPEQLIGSSVGRQSDVWSASVVLWELLTGKRLFKAESEGKVVTDVMSAPIVAPSEIVRGLPRALDLVVLRGLERDPFQRFASGREMALALERALPLATPSAIGAFVEAKAAATLADRDRRVAELESASSSMAREGQSIPSLVAAAQKRTATSAPVTGPNDATMTATAAPARSEDGGAGGASSRRTLLGWVAAAGALSAAATIAVTQLSSPGGAAHASAPAAESAAGTVVAAASEPVPFAATAAASVVTAAPAAAPSAGTPAAAPSAGAPVAALTPRRGQAHASGAALPKPAPPAPAPAASAKPACDAPYTVDSSGYKHYKPECL